MHDGEFGILADALHVALYLALDPVPRIMHMRDRISKPLIIASDAMAEQGVCRGGYLAIDLESGDRWGSYWEFSPGDLSALGYPSYSFDSTGNPIAQCEAAAVFTALYDCEQRGTFFGR